ncbi:MAG: hypothetical protein AB8H79_15810 [Myxococcota bacterium]
MLLLLSYLALAIPGTAELACVDALPAEPSKAERRTPDEVRAMIALQKRPGMLVPLKFEDQGVDRYKGPWKDEAGGRWSWAQVKTLFDHEPYSAAHLEAMRSEGSVAREGESSASFRMAEVHAAAIHQGLGGGVSAKHGIITRRKYRAEHTRYKSQLATAEAFEAGEPRHIARAICAFNMAPQLHAAEAEELAAQEKLMAEAEAAGGPDAAMWNLARMLQDNRGAGAPGLDAAKTVQRCMDAGTSTGDLLTAADDAPAEGTLAEALAAGGLACAQEPPPGQ